MIYLRSCLFNYPNRSEVTDTYHVMRVQRSALRVTEVQQEMPLTKPDVISAGHRGADGWLWPEPQGMMGKSFVENETDGWKEILLITTMQHNV